MPDAPVLGAQRKVKLDESAFGARFHGPLVHETVRSEQAARRRGTAATKTRGMVSGGGAKPWRQKGTGRARAGSTRSPVWTGGGVVFGPQPRSYTTKVNRKERRAALRSALSVHAERDSIALLQAGDFAEPRTRQARELLDEWGQIRPTLVVLSAEEANAALSFRNLPRVAVLTPESVGVADLIGSASLLVSQPALDALTARAIGEVSRVGGATDAREAPAPAAEAPKAKAPKAKAPKAAGRARAADVGEATKPGEDSDAKPATDAVDAPAGEGEATEGDGS
jgi:large subunit ribosomal protein L4